jgi:DNA-binding XRE family transcriptional regulator
MTFSVLKRIINKSIKVDDCWLFLGCRLEGGYGIISDENRRLVLVHRYIYQKVNKKQLPREIGVLHKCDTPNCWQPKHLFEGTQAVNIADKVAKNRQAKGESHGCVKLLEIQVIKIRRLYLTGNYSQRRLARMFNVTQTTIYRIVNGKNWKI